MRKSRKSKSSSSTSKRKRRADAARPKQAAQPQFSVLSFKFATPDSLRTLLRLAASFVLLAQAPVQAGPGSIASQLADGISRSVGLAVARSLEVQLTRPPLAAGAKEKP